MESNHDQTTYTVHNLKSPNLNSLKYTIIFLETSTSGYLIYNINLL